MMFRLSWAGGPSISRLYYVPSDTFLHNGSVFIFLCCITNYHKCNNLKQYTLIISVFVHLETRHNLVGFSTRLQSRCHWPGLVCIWRLDWGRVCFSLTLVIGRIQIFAALEPVVVCFFRASKESKTLKQIYCQGKSPVEHNIIMGKTPHLL